MRILIVYGTTDGQTRRIAHRIADVLTSQGADVEALDASQPHAPREAHGFDGALVLGSVRMGRHPEPLVSFVRTNHAALAAIPNAFLSVSLSAARDNPAAKREVQKTFHDFIVRTGFRPDALVPVAGALLYTKYPFHIRLLMKLIAKLTGNETDTSRDYEYTDWAAVDDFARRFAGALAQSDLARVAQRELAVVP